MLLRKHASIRDQLGVAVAVPMDTEVVEEVLKEGLLMRDGRAGAQLAIDFPMPAYAAFDTQWNAAVEREKKSRAIFAQHQLQKAIDDEIARELAEVQRAIGGEADVERFALTAWRGRSSPRRAGGSARWTPIHCGEGWVSPKYGSAS